MQYKHAVITGIKDDIVKGRIVISVEVARDPDNMKISEELAHYSGKEPQDVDVLITPRQMKLRLPDADFIEIPPEIRSVTPDVKEEKKFDTLPEDPKVEDPDIAEAMKEDPESLIPNDGEG